MYVPDGNCQILEKGELYSHERGVVHEVINISPNEVVFVRLSIPQDTPASTIQV
jgi:quercetin dioxygenase-like cupin family protein